MREGEQRGGRGRGGGILSSGGSRTTFDGTYLYKLPPAQSKRVELHASPPLSPHMLLLADASAHAYTRTYDTYTPPSSTDDSHILQNSPAALMPPSSNKAPFSKPTRRCLCVGWQRLSHVAGLSTGRKSQLMQVRACCRMCTCVCIARARIGQGESRHTVRKGCLECWYACETCTRRRH